MGGVFPHRRHGGCPPASRWVASAALLAAVSPPPALARIPASFDCEAGLATHWSAEAQEWCCANHGIKCQAPFDCVVGHDKWRTGWSEGKKIWCCQRQGIACEGREPFECDNVPQDWRTSWAQSKKVWCCENKGVACRIPFDCAAGLSKWQTGWSSGKKSWCCRHKKMGCEDRFVYMKHNGFITNGGDIKVEVLTISAAKRRCSLIPNCFGFTVKGDAADERWSRVEVYFKSKWDLHLSQHQSFTSFQRIKVNVPPGDDAGSAIVDDGGVDGDGAAGNGADGYGEYDGDSASSGGGEYGVVTFFRKVGSWFVDLFRAILDWLKWVWWHITNGAMTLWAWTELGPLLSRRIPGTRAPPGAALEIDPWQGAGVPWWVLLAIALWLVVLCCCICGLRSALAEEAAERHDEETDTKQRLFVAQVARSSTRDRLD